MISWTGTYKGIIEEIEYENNQIITNTETKTLIIEKISNNYYKLIQPSGNISIGLSTKENCKDLLIMLDTDENTSRNMEAIKICNNNVIKFKQTLREKSDKTVVQIGTFIKNNI